MSLIGRKVTGKPRFQGGPITYSVFANVAVGQLVKFGTAGDIGNVGPASAGAACVGVATKSAVVAGTSNTGTSPSGYPTVDPYMPSNETAVARRGAFYLNATGGFNPGDFVKAGANGSVVKWDPAADQAVPQVGQCVDTVAATNGSVSLIDLNIQG